MSLQQRTFDKNTERKDLLRPHWQFLFKLKLNLNLNLDLNLNLNLDLNLKTLIGVPVEASLAIPF